MKIRQEINLINQELSSTTSSSTPDAGHALIEPPRYNDATFYYEILAKNTDSVARSVGLQGFGGGPTISIPSGTTAFTLFRSAALTPSQGIGEPTVTLPATTSAGQVVVKAARIIAIQNGAALWKTETQIEIGYQAATTSTAFNTGPLSRPKYWQYNAADWDGTKTFYWDVTCKAGNTKSGFTAQLQVADGTGNGFQGWAAVGSDLTRSSLAIGIVRSAAFTPVDGRWYRVVFKTGTTKSAATIYGAHIVVTQTGEEIDSGGAAAANAVVYGGTAGSGETNQAVSQSFQVAANCKLSGIDITVTKNNLPTDSFTAKIYSGSQTGTLLGSAESVTFDGFPNGRRLVFSFASLIDLTASTTYYCVFERTGARDTTNYPILPRDNVDLITGGFAQRDNNSWGSDFSFDLALFRVFIEGNLTKLEAQYLLLNKIVDSGTGFQLTLEKWDTAEWDSVTNTYVGQAGNGTAATITVQEADGGSTIYTVTNPATPVAQSSATMPATSQNIDVKMTVNTDATFEARILARVVVQIGAGAVELSGSATGAGTSSGSIQKTVKITGSASGAGTASGSLKQIRQLSGAATGAGVSSATMQKTVKASGAATGAGTSSAVIEKTVKFSGSATGAGTASGSLTVTSAEKQLSGASTGAGTATGSLYKETRLAGASAGAGASSGVIQKTVRASGSAGGAGVASGSLTHVRYCSGTSAGAGAVSGILQKTIQFSGSINGAGASSGVIQKTALMSGSASGAGTSSGVIQKAALFAGTSTGAGSSSGTFYLTKYFSGAPEGNASVTGSLSVTPATPEKLLDGAALGAGVASGSIRKETHITGSASGTGASSGVLQIAKQLTGTVAGTGTATAILRLLKTFAGTIAGQGISQAIFELQKRLSGSIAGSGASSATALAVTKHLSGTITGAGTVTGSLQQEGFEALSGTASGAGTASGSLNVRKTLAGSVSGAGATSGGIYIQKALTGLASGTSQALGSLSVVPPEIHLTGTPSGAGIASGSLQLEKRFAGAIAAHGQSSALMRLEKRFAGTIAGTSQSIGLVSLLHPLSGIIQAHGQVIGGIMLTKFLRGAITGTGTLRGDIRGADILGYVTLDDGRSYFVLIDDGRTFYNKR